MALDFPATPVVGDLYPDPPQSGLPQYRWDGEAWLGGPVAPAGVENFVAKTGDTMTGQLNAPAFAASAPSMNITLTLTNLSVGLSKLLRVNDAGGLEIINNANSAVVITMGDDGAFNCGTVTTNSISVSTMNVWDVVGFHATASFMQLADFYSLLRVRPDLPAGMYNCAMNLSYAGGGDQFGITFRPIADGPNVLSFCNAANGLVGSISQNASNTAYNTSSSGELKENLTAFDAGPILDAVEVWNFTWKSTGEPAYGVIAQQVNEVFADAVTHVPPNTAMKDDEPTPEWWGVDYSKFVPLLLQEIKALRARLAEVEAKLV